MISWVSISVFLNFDFPTVNCYDREVSFRPAICRLIAKEASSARSNWGVDPTETITE
ncbi:hypothetical protein TcasGA2_TC034278 [Tribolium castaneum]|uniref:Uncharacterized protein n=1 Tax=Tribolium castaneum TaxID=7070 RepID=A0A139WC02_TRICA|nr:hypothetical protein TcasGA2_TC034278 [Tribolium castaneum]